jgi:hypothetical protein
MRKNYLLLFLLAVLLAVGLLSCKSTPPAEEPAKEEPKVAQDVVNAAAARAEAARKRAMDFDAPAYFPSEWESVEAQYDEAAALPRETVLDVQRAAALYGEAAIIYDGLFENAVPLYAQAREDEIIAARDELIASGFTSYFPDYLEGADEVALQAQDEYEKKDYYAAKDTAGRALEIYATLNSGAAAYQARKEITTHGFETYDSENFEKAEEAGTNAVDAYDKGDIKGAREGADEAQLRYNLVLNAGWENFAADYGTAAEEERQHALDVKGNVALRDSFNAANEIYEQGEASLEAEKYAEAAALFQQSEAQFAEIARVTEEKRTLAEAAIREAAERAEASDEAARRAEEIIEGGSE